jgi:hypothetical protein
MRLRKLGRLRKTDALQMQDLSMQAYDAYSKTMRGALLEASEKLKI